MRAIIELGTITIRTAIPANAIGTLTVSKKQAAPLSSKVLNKLHSQEIVFPKLFCNLAFNAPFRIAHLWVLSI